MESRNGALNVGNAIDNFFNNGGALPPAFASVFGLTGTNLTNALDQLSGEAATGAQKVAFQLTDQFLNLMLDPFVDGRSGVGGADHPALPFAPERETTPPEIALAYASVFKTPPKAVPVYEPRWTVWGGAYGGSNSTSGDTAVIGSHDLSARTVGFVGGFDYRLTPDTLVGLAFADGGTDWPGWRQERCLSKRHLRRDEIRSGLSRSGLRIRQPLDVGHINAPSPAGVPKRKGHTNVRHPPATPAGADFTFCAVETVLAGWACKIRTGESVGELSDWICVTIRPEVGAIRVAETLRVPAA